MEGKTHPRLNMKTKSTSFEIKTKQGGYGKMRKTNQRLVVEFEHFTTNLSWMIFNVICVD